MGCVQEFSIVGVVVDGVVVGVGAAVAAFPVRPVCSKRSHRRQRIY